MSMRDNVGTGYCVLLEEVINKLMDANQKKEFSELFDYEEQRDFIGKICKEKGMPEPIGVYELSEEDSSDFFQTGDAFVIWDEDDLFVMTKTDTHNKLIKQGVKPQKATWNVWG
jgi:hypothetical protein